MADAFARYAGADLLATAGDAAALAAAAHTRLRDNETWEDLFFRLLLAHVEPRIGRATHLPDALAGNAGGAGAA